MNTFKFITSGSTPLIEFDYKLDDESRELFSKSEWVLFESVLNVDKGSSLEMENSSSGDWEDIKDLIPT